VQGQSGDPIAVCHGGAHRRVLVHQAPIEPDLHLVIAPQQEGGGRLVGRLDEGRRIGGTLLSLAEEGLVGEVQHRAWAAVGPPDALPADEAGLGHDLRLPGEEVGLMRAVSGEDAAHKPGVDEAVIVGVEG